MAENVDSLASHAAGMSNSIPSNPRISIKLKAGNLADNISMLKQSWARVAPGQNFDYKFLDQAIANQYKQEQRTNMIIQLASILSIFIACMGLFGLATLTISKRVKEIGIRKVMGASITGIVKLLFIDFAKLVIIASVVAYPIAWLAINKWLQDFQYRVGINWWVFILAGSTTILIALATVSYHAIKASLINPIKSLRNE
jgi:putative ABC transport system permease protein